MATGTEIDDATVEFATEYCSEHHTPTPTAMPQAINPPFSSIDKISAYNKYTAKLKAISVNKFLGITAFESSRTWRQLSDVAFDAQSV